MSQIYKGRKLLFRSVLSVSAFVAAISFSATAAMMQYQSAINDFLKTPSSIIVDDGKESEKVDYKKDKSDFKTLDELIAHENEVDQQIGEEGTVLLKNENNALPLSKGTRVSVFGAGCVNFTTGGKGSGSSNYNGDTMKEALIKAGFSINDDLWNYYVEKVPADGSWRGTFGGSSSLDNNGSLVGEIPYDNLSAAAKNSVQSSDVGIFMLTRSGGEGVDLTINGTESQDFDHYFELNDAEKSILKAMKETTSKQILVLNVNNAMGIGFLDEAEYGIDAALWIGGTGNMGINGLCNVLSGAANPSGRTVDTWASSSLSSPAIQNAGYMQFENYLDVYAKTGSSQVINSTDYDFYWNDAYITENEGIYVGYKYYETRYEDAVMNRGNAKSSAGVFTSSGDWNYVEEVARPFGYGLSYTDFKEDLDKVEYDKASDSYVLTVTVTNTGTVAGKDVVEAYFQSPYTTYDVTNNVEKSAVNLGGFTKTSKLKPDQSETVQLSIKKRDMASYDYTNAKTYIFEEGTQELPYYIAIGKNAHDALNNILADKGYSTKDGMDQEGKSSNAYRLVVKETGEYATSVTGEKITNQLDDANLNNYGVKTTYLTRNDWTTFPKTQKVTATDKMIENLRLSYYTPSDDQAGEISAKYGSSYLNGNGEKIPLIIMRGVDYDDDSWDTILDELSVQDMAELVAHGYHRIAAIDSITLPEVSVQDGPTGFSKNGKYAGTNITNHAYPVEVLIAATWNKELVREIGELVGEDGIWSNIYGWYAPAINIHRTPYSGRNFEYFSEDAIFNGQLVAEEIQGAMSKGLEVFVKHYAMNDQEDHRNGLATFGNEQGFRESYLKAFEYAVVEGKTNAMMSSLNRIGCTFVGMHEGLSSKILRDEWGFNGIVKTDMFRTKDPYMDPISTVVISQTMFLSKSGNEHAYDAFLKYGATDLKVYEALRKAAHSILYVSANSGAMNGLSTSSKLVKVTPWWITTIITLDAVFGVLLVTGAGLVVLNDLVWDKKKGE